MSHRRCYLLAQGGTTHSAAYADLEALQRLVGDEGAAQFPLFLRLGGTPQTTLQPVNAGALLGEVERFVPKLVYRLVPGVRFDNESGQELGHMFTRGDDHVLAEGSEATLAADSNGIRISVTQMPPPPGFRSNPSEPAGRYHCYFTVINATGDGWQGRRTEDFGGGGVPPVALPSIPLPSVTRWDVARVAGKPTVAALSYVEAPATEIYRDLIHGVTSACTESLRHRVPLFFRRDI